MRKIFAQRLKNARKLAGMSQDDLVSAIDAFVSKTSIAKYERAEMMPDSGVILRLSKALGVVPGYFMRAFNVNIKKPEFRKKKSLSQKELESIEQKVMSSLEAYIELEELAGRADIFNPPLFHLSIQSDKDVELAAKELLDVWHLGLNGITSVFSVIEEKGIRLIEVEANEAFDGFSTFANGGIPVIVVNKAYTVERKRLTVLHELGHLVLPFSDEISADKKRKENLCFRFGAALMMPQDCFFKEIGRKRHELQLSELILLKVRYGLSVQAIVRRAWELQVINDFHYKSWQIRFSANKKEEGWGNYPMNEQSSRFDQLLIRSVAEQVISTDKAAELSGLTISNFTSKYEIQ